MEKKEKNVIARVGNFVIVKESGNGMDWVSVKAVSGNWTVRYREDSRMYGMLVMMSKNKALRPYLENWVTSLYLMAQSTPDLKFYEEFLHAYEGLQERSKLPDATEEEDKAALEEVRTMEEMKEEADGTEEQ